MERTDRERFSTALNYLLKKRGRGTQAELSRKQGIDSGYLNGIIKGRTRGSEEVREAIAEFFGTSALDMLLMGDSILKGNKPSQSITNSNNVVQSGGDISGNINISTNSPEIAELINLLEHYASKAELAQLIKQYRKKESQFKD